MPSLELWGGLECTINRVGHEFRDQVRESGHHGRPSDLDKFATLGLSAIRYPVLWERVSPDDPALKDWQWSDARLARLRMLELRPILGLVHHGSGPHYTDLLADSFAPGLAAFAGAVAQRYPWIDEYTPVNEPVTTARFAALYGHWYPHLRDERAFWSALINQIDATCRAMRAIRRVNAKAKLLQTDDLGRTFATAAVREQAAFDNVRRWMGWDLLCGRVVPGHDMWARLCGYGFERRLRAIADAPCPPDTIGVNHYLTSDRFLDHRFRRYPEGLRGGSDNLRYADTEAVRVLQPPPPGLEGVLREAWERYGLPIAVTELHNGCTREEQMRWLAQGWATASRLRDAGIDIRAVTAWSLIGSSGWDTLLTAQGRYEPGVFAVQGDDIVPTAMAPLMRQLREAGTLPHAARGAGWWQRDSRFHAPAVARPCASRHHVPPSVGRGPPLLFAGLPGKAASLLMRLCSSRGLAWRVLEQDDKATPAHELGEPPLGILYDVRAARVPAVWAQHDIVAIAVGSCPTDDVGHALLDQVIDLVTQKADQAAKLHR